MHWKMCMIYVSVCDDTLHSCPILEIVALACMFTVHGVLFEEQEDLVIFRDYRFPGSGVFLETWVWNKQCIRTSISTRLKEENWVV